MEHYEIQIQLYENNQSVWASLVDVSGTPLYIFENEEEAIKALEKLQVEHSPKQCRIMTI